MDNFKSLYQQVFSVTPESFRSLALELFHFQYAHNPIYKAYVNHLTVNPAKVTELTSIPFLPIEFFKGHQVATGSWKQERIFESSGTTGMATSKHFVFDSDFYLQNCRRAFEQEYGSLSEYTILALLPSYLERS